MDGKLWQGAESEADRIAREKIEGLRPDPTPLDTSQIAPLGAQVDDEGTVIAVLTCVHPDTIEQADVIALDSLAGIAVGKPLPWPRGRRDALLAECDWTALRTDKPHAWREAWAAYRTALRDLPDTQPDPMAITWPEAPAA